MAEDDGLGKTLARQLLRTRRPFTTTVFDAGGAARARRACGAWVA